MEVPSQLPRPSADMPPYQSFRPEPTTGKEVEEGALAWAFDLDGFVILRGVAAAAPTLLTVDDALQRAPPPQRVMEIIRLLCGAAAEIHGGADNTPGLMGTAASPMGSQREHDFIEWALDRPPSVLQPRQDDPLGWETDTAADELYRLEYDTESRALDRTGRFAASVWGLRLVYCCAHASGSGSSSSSSELLVAPASHKSGIHPPPSMAVARAMGGTVTVQLQPGDCLLAAATTLLGLSSDNNAISACSASSVSGLVQHVLGRTAVIGEPARGVWRDSREPAPEPAPLVSGAQWHRELSEAQRRLLTPSRRSIPAHGDGAAHLSLLPRGDTGCVGPHEELWFWDTYGYLVVKGVMDPDWLAAANAAIDACEAGPLYTLDDPTPRHQREQIARQEVVLDRHVDGWCSPTIASVDGTPEQRIAAPWQLPGALGEPFRRMIDCEAFNSRLRWILGPGFYYTASYAIVSKYGAAGQRMHSGPFYSYTQGYRLRGGLPRCGGLNIGWALRDVVTERGDGGLMLIPGSHKSRHPLPVPPTHSCDLHAVKHVQLAAGDVVIYMGGETTHGVRAWRNPDAGGGSRRFVATKAQANVEATAPAVGNPGAARL